MKKFAKILAAAVAGWLSGLGVILLVLYFGNGGSDFTMTDFTGFGVLFVVASGLLMLVVYLPALFWLRRKNPKQLYFPLFAGLVLNVPVFVLLALLIGKKTSTLESIGFMFTFLVVGLVFGFGFSFSECGKREI